MEHFTETYRLKDESGKEYTGMAMILKPKRWKQYFPTYEYHLMICRALNFCTQEHGLKVIGYWLNERETFLIIGNGEEEWEQINFKLNRYLNTEIRSQQKWQRALREGVTIEDDALEKKELNVEELFEIRPLLNHAVICLLISNELPTYYDPQLAKIKESARQSQFSSINSALKKAVILSKKK